MFLKVLSSRSTVLVESLWALPRNVLVMAYHTIIRFILLLSRLHSIQRMVAFDIYHKSPFGGCASLYPVTLANSIRTWAKPGSYVHYIKLLSKSMRPINLNLSVMILCFKYLFSRLLWVPPKCGFWGNLRSDLSLTHLRKELAVSHQVTHLTGWGVIQICGSQTSVLDLCGNHSCNSKEYIYIWTFIEHT